MTSESILPPTLPMYKDDLANRFNPYVQTSCCGISVNLQIPRKSIQEGAAQREREGPLCRDVCGEGKGETDGNGEQGGGVCDCLSVA